MRTSTKLKAFAVLGVGAGLTLMTLPEDNFDHVGFAVALEQSADLAAKNGGIATDLDRFHATPTVIGPNETIKTGRAAMEITLGKAGIFFERMHADTVAAAACLQLSATGIQWPEHALNAYNAAELSAANGKAGEATNAYLIARDTCLAAISTQSTIHVLDNFSAKQS